MTLPVEFDASHRAMGFLTEYGILSENEADGSRRVLRAAAMTYVAAAAAALLNLPVSYTHLEHTGKTYQLGETVTVRVTGANRYAGTVDFELEEAEKRGNDGKISTETGREQ